MKCDPEIVALLAASAAGVLEPQQERRLREHVRNCPECARALREFAEIASALPGLPVPDPPVDLTKQTQWLLAAEFAARADQRQAAVLAGVVGICGWAGAASGVYLWWLWSGNGTWAWLLWWLLPPMIIAPAAAALQRSRTGRRTA